MEEPQNRLVRFLLRHGVVLSILGAVFGSWVCLTGEGLIGRAAGLFCATSCVGWAQSIWYTRRTDGLVSALWSQARIIQLDNDRRNQEYLKYNGDEIEEVSQ